MLASLPDHYRAAVFGSSGDIGAAFVQRLVDDPRCAAVYAGARQTLPATAKLQPFRFDLEDEASIESAAQQCHAGGPLHLVLVATGLLHAPDLTPEKSWRSLSAETMARAFAVNATGPSLVAKHMLELLSRQDKSVFAALSARVGSISDNRLGGWHAYRASKAALNMLIKCCSIELARRNRSAICVALHPGTVDTPLSRPFQSSVAPSKLFEPQKAASDLLAVLDGLAPSDSGFCYAWDGEVVPA